MRIKDDKRLISVMDEELRSLYILINALKLEYEDCCKLDSSDLINFFSEANDRLSYYKYHIEDETLSPCTKLFTRCDNVDPDKDCLKCMKETGEV